LAAKTQLHDGLAEIAPGWPVADESRYSEQANAIANKWSGWETEVVDGFLFASAGAMDLLDYIDDPTDADPDAVKRAAQDVPAGFSLAVNTILENDSDEMTEDGLDELRQAVHVMLLNTSKTVPQEMLDEVRQATIALYRKAEMAWESFQAILRCGAAATEQAIIVLSAPAGPKPEVSQTDSANTAKLFPKGLPQNPDIVDLVVRLDTAKGTDKSDIAIAREFTGEPESRDGKARSLLSQIRRMRRNGRITP
jgi:hypothetical protein